MDNIPDGDWYCYECIGKVGVSYLSYMYTMFYMPPSCYWRMAYSSALECLCFRTFTAPSTSFICWYVFCTYFKMLFIVILQKVYYPYWIKIWNVGISYTYVWNL